MRVSPWITFGVFVAFLAVPLLTSGGQQSPPAGQAATKPAPTALDLNSATAAQLNALPGIGPALAARILEYRQKQGGFKKIEELMNVRGIGEKNFLKLKPLIRVGSGLQEKDRRAGSSR